MRGWMIILNMAKVWKHKVNISNPCFRPFFCLLPCMMSIKEGGGGVIWGAELWQWLQKRHPPAIQNLCVQRAVNQKQVQLKEGGLKRTRSINCLFFTNTYLAQLDSTRFYLFSIPVKYPLSKVARKAHDVICMWCKQSLCQASSGI